MCAISGILNFDMQNVLHTDLQLMNDIQQHRGPDDEGIWINKNIGFGHRRLSIIDLSGKAHQPMVSADNNYVIVFNGEIYNYRDLQKIILGKGLTLKTNSDTEVILYLYRIYKENFLGYLRGMFAIAIWDNHEQSLVLARDRIGIKPLYYYKDDSRLIFASEIKAIAALNPALSFNEDAFFKYIRRSAFTENQSVFNEINRIEPGTYLKIQNGSISSLSYWNLLDIYNRPTYKFRNDEEAIDSFNHQLNESVKYHLISDVPVGGFLSGGLDSSSLIGLMRRQQPNQEINSYSICFDKHPHHFNEEYYSDLVSRHLSTNHHKIDFDDSFLRLMEELVWYCDEPFGIYSSFGLFELSKKASEQVKVVLSGDGGDELLAGYQGYLTSVEPNYYSFRFLFYLLGSLLDIRFNNKPIRSEGFDRFWLKLKSHSGSHSFNYSNAFTYASLESFLCLNSDYLKTAWDSWENNQTAYYYSLLSGDSEIRRRMFSVMKTRLVDEMLAKVDRMSMAHSLEARVPFLDHIFLEFCVSLPDDLKIRQVGPNQKLSKYILRRSMETILPHGIIYRNKHGFDMPVNTWIRDNIKLVADRLSYGTLIKNNIINQNRLDEVIKKHTNKSIDDGMFLLNLFVFEVWCDVYKNKIKNFSLRF